MEAEIEENEIRLNLSWQEKASATNALHALREAQRIAHTLPGLISVPQSPRDTAAEIRDKPAEAVTIHEIRDTKADLLVAAWLQEDDPDVSNAKTRKEALTIIERKLNEGHQLALAREFKARQSPDQTHTLLEADALTELPKIPENTFDCIITDPPYGRSAHTWPNGLGQPQQHNYLDDMHSFETLLSSIATEGYRVCKPKAHLYCFCDINSFHLLHRMFTSAGWDVWPRPLIWYKGNHGSIAPRPEHGPRQTYEAILFANKGDKRVLSLRHDIIFIQKRQDDTRAAEKPPALFLELLSRSTLPGDLILDPCCGTGPVFPAANKLSCRATGFDIDPTAVGIATTRLSNTVSFSSPPDYPTEGLEEPLAVPSAA
jgi:DNA modification methylase